MAKIHTYLNFEGNTEEAFNFYKSVFGGEFSHLQRVRDTPEADKVSEAEQDKIMHIALPIESNLLMATDILESYGMKIKQGNNMYVSIEAESEEEARRIFSELSQGGNIEMELKEMFWGDLFASFTDRYGINWMLNYELKK
ncbi:MAG TPA: VOC family protein [Salinimicrobium sp.]|nr:VOC family protein [Salinimicrobium sp.]